MDAETANMISEIAATASTAAVFILGIVSAKRAEKKERRARAEARRITERKRRAAEIKAAGLRLMAEDARRQTASENAPKRQTVKVCGYMSKDPRYVAVWQS